MICKFEVGSFYENYVSIQLIYKYKLCVFGGCLIDPWKIFR